MTLAVLVIWVVGAAVTKYSLEQMAYLAPVAVVVVGATIGLVLLWVKIVRESMRRARGRERDAAPPERTRDARGSAPRHVVVVRPGLDLSWLHGRKLEGRARVVPRGRTRSWRSSASPRPSRACSCAAGSAIPTRHARSSQPEGITHDPLLLGDMAAAVARLRTAVERGERICVHGDYDVDGICATALATLTLRELGADVVWHLPSRFEEGYGVSHDDDRAARGGRREAHPHGRLRHHRRPPRSRTPAGSAST